MRKRVSGLSIIMLSYFQIILLISVSFAFSFMLSENRVSAQSQSVDPGIIVPEDPPIQSIDLPPIQTEASVYGEAVREAVREPGTLNNLGALNNKLPSGSGGGLSGRISLDGFSTTTAKFENADLTGRFGDWNGQRVFMDTDKSIMYKVGADGTLTKRIGSGYYQKGPFGVGGTSNFFYGNLLQGVMLAASVAGVIMLIGQLAGLDEELTTSLAVSSAAGIIGGKALYGLFGKGIPGKAGAQGLFGKGLTPGYGFAIGVGIAVIVFLIMYKKEKIKEIVFQCLPWQPPTGGANCDKCNQDSQQPCSEYRCKSLGQACDLVNKGTVKEQCVWISRNDVNSPTITPLLSALNTGFSYKPLVARPTALGTRIVKGQEGCLEAFTPLTFGLQTNEPAQCKIDYEIKNYSEMQFYFGESNYYLINHTQNMRLPSPKTDAGETAPLFKNDGTFNLYVRCQDANGNVNEDAYTVEFCVNKGPDATPPRIEGTSIISGSPVRYQVDTTPITLFVNEPAQCKWSRQDRTYDNMENSMTCADSARLINAQLTYECQTNLTGITDREDNNFFFRCRDGSGNTNVESEHIVLKGSQPLNILEVKPNGTIYGSTLIVPVTLEVLTDDGSSEGVAKCYYNGTYTIGYEEMSDTDDFNHKQTQDLISGDYKYQFRCIDAGGNVANSETSFNVFVDKQAPIVTRTYRDTALKIVTNEDAECSYSLQSCNFNLAEGIKMEYSNVKVKNALYAPWKSQQTYYIKCTDKYGNQPAPNECSVIISPRGPVETSD